MADGLRYWLGRLASPGGYRLTRKRLPGGKAQAALPTFFDPPLGQLTNNPGHAEGAATAGLDDVTRVSAFLEQPPGHVIDGRAVVAGQINHNDHPPRLTTQKLGLQSTPAYDI